MNRGSGLLALCLIFLLVSCRPDANERSGESARDLQEGLPVALEIIGVDSSFNADSLFQAWNVSADLEGYHWNRHLVLYGHFEADSLRDRIAAFLPEAEVKLYRDPMYVFDRNNHCEAGPVADKWRNYLLSANLVEDSVMQQEYINYHITQFEEWPEVSQGFCNAEFQQLLVFKNGRQLLLVISIPKGKSLDELNPKTVEDNPRVVEWNELMSQYQEGLADAGPNEVWVFLEPMNH